MRKHKEDGNVLSLTPDRQYLHLACCLPICFLPIGLFFACLAISYQHMPHTHNQNYASTNSPYEKYPYKAHKYQCKTCWAVIPTIAQYNTSAKSIQQEWMLHQPLEVKKFRYNQWLSTMATQVHQHTIKFAAFSMCMYYR